MASSNTNTFDESESMRILEDTTDVGFVIAYRSSLQYLHRIFNLHLRCDLHQYQFSDIALEQYLGCSSRITDSDTEKRKMRIQEITARKAEDKNSKSDELANVTGKLDVMIKNGDTKINLNPYDGAGTIRQACRSSRGQACAVLSMPTGTYGKRMT